jgi:hypothetical protein
VEARRSGQFIPLVFIFSYFQSGSYHLVSEQFILGCFTKRCSEPSFRVGYLGRGRAKMRFSPRYVVLSIAVRLVRVLLRGPVRWRTMELSADCCVHWAIACGVSGEVGCNLNVVYLRKKGGVWLHHQVCSYSSARMCLFEYKISIILVLILELYLFGCQIMITLAQFMVY